MTVQTLFIHAGGPKTGTSAIQNFLEIREPDLQNIGLAYRNRLNIRSVFEIQSGNGVHLWKLLSCPGALDHEIDECLRSYMAPTGNAICSSEFIGELAEPHWKSLQASCQRIGLRLVVLYFVRNVLPYLSSEYDQAIKRHGEYRPFEAWVAEGDWNHAHMLRVLRAALPADCLRVIHYDSICSNLLNEFLRQVDVDPGRLPNVAEQSIRVNRSLTNFERETLCKLNMEFGVDISAGLSDLFLLADPSSDSDPPKFDHETVMALETRFAEDIQWVNDSFFGAERIVALRSIAVAGDRIVCTVGIPEEPQGVKSGACLVDQLASWSSDNLARSRDKGIDLVRHCCRDIDWTNADHPDIPADFHPVAYILLNPDIVHVLAKPFEHFITYGQYESERRWAWADL